MAVNRLCAAFRQITIRSQGKIFGRYYSSDISKEHAAVPLLSNPMQNALYSLDPKVHIRFVPKTLNIDLGNPDSATRKNINELPISIHIPSMEDPLIRKPIQQDLPLNKSFELPSPENIFEKLAIRLIVIRRKKMKKHKRKKLRKRMQFVWGKLRARRNVLKEKLFQAEMIAKIKEAQKFDAKVYVQERLAILDKERLPKTYRGEILPPDMIRQFLQQEKEKRERRLNKPRLTLD